MYRVEGDTRSSGGRVGGSPPLPITCHSRRESRSAFDAELMVRVQGGEGWGPGSYLGGCGQVQGKDVGSGHP